MDKCPTCGQPLPEPEPLPIRYRFLKVNKTPQEIVKVDYLPGATSHWKNKKYYSGPVMILCKEREG